MDKIKCFLAFGVSPNACDYDRRTALHLAVCKGFPHIANILISQGADVNFQDRWEKAPLDYISSAKNVPNNVRRELKSILQEG